MYSLPRLDFEFLKNKAPNFLKNRVLLLSILAVIVLIVIGFYTQKLSMDYLQNQINSLILKTENDLMQPFSEKSAGNYASKIEYEQAIIEAVKSASPSVVSIIISKNLPVYEQQFINPFEDSPNFGFGDPFNLQIPQYVQKGTQKQEVGAGSGFIVSEDGLVLTNKHVVIDKEAEYTVLTNDEKRYSAKVLALDPVQDLAIVKIQGEKKFPAILLGNSSGIQTGQGAIAIGNSLGEFRNTVSVGVISGLGRTVSASGTGGFSELLEDVIQTDAAINPGNSGGPLINLKGEVIGVNVAMAQGAQSIGFAIPIDIAKRDINQIIKSNKLSYPFLGIRYVLVDESIKEKYNLSVDYGVLIFKGRGGESAISKDSSAEKAGLKENDIILEFNGQKITKVNSLAKIIAKYSPQEKITLKILRDGKEINIEVILGERS